MIRRLSSLAALFAALFAALAASPAVAERLGGGYHVMLTPSAAQAMGRVPPRFDANTAASPGYVKYYGGSVFTSAQVVSVMWGATVNPSIVAGIPGFSAALVDSTFVDQLAEYDTMHKAIDGRPGTHQHIGRGAYLGQFVITPANTSRTLADEDVQAELKAQVAAGHLPPRTLQTLYMVYFPADVTVTLDGMTSCVEFSAYHFATVDTKLSRGNLFYSVEPDCGSGFADITYAASHEFAEAVTDNVPTPGTFPAYPQAWNTTDGYEVADLCPSITRLRTADGHVYGVTQVFLNSRRACGTGSFTSP